ncbi:1-aminocyclopropane-1-carboxylate deaminase [Brumimicrobium salinarum]|uniref:1-aminocyclopropane-1-carboxylate deaminase n=1 Tax=Brumimicrobium salinarum TaxID=2058658 RepID=A0A2I0R049_9FLAO|nr:pyridoxal-phosphate dependent enzyme [Brumimicrobium salinarum]PKR79966.1 1-aminocyclopropane-1-carboxylate deaminase [Brumimicrobium salinarum]
MNTSNSIIQKVHLPIQGGELFSFDVKRDDLIDPIISGNKWRKLEYSLEKAKQLGKSGVLTFGGPFSNHLIATAKAAADADLSAVGIVRGDELNVESNPTLRACNRYGMKLIFISRSEYKRKDELDYQKELANLYSSYFIIPEGGKNYFGVIGCQHILNEATIVYDHVYLAGGTGTTAAGVLLSAPEKTKVHVVSALKGNFMRQNVKELLMMVLQNKASVEEYMLSLFEVNAYHFGGYAKVNEELIDFINYVFQATKLKLDPIYTSKALFAMVSDYKSGKIKSTDKILFIHTGGLQGAKKWIDKIDYSIDIL